MERQVKRKEQKRKQLDAGARLKLLKDLFYQIDKSGDKMVNQEELASMLESISTDYEILEVFLREKCGLNSIAGGDNVIEDDAENEGGGGELTSAVILRAIDSDDDGMISFEEWCRFMGDGHQNYDPLDDDAAPEVVKASKKTEDFRRLQKIQDAADTSKAQEAARERERLAKEKKRMALLDEREAAIALDKKRKEDAIQRKLQELEDEKRRMAEEKGRRAELERTKALSDEQKNKKIQMLEERNKAAMEAMERDRARREQERTIERKKLKKAKKKRKKMQKSMEEKRVPRPPDNMISHWRPYHVVEWLEKKLDLGQYSEAFANSSVDGLLLISLSDKDMRTTLGIRRRLHRAKIGVHVSAPAVYSRRCHVGFCLVVFFFCRVFNFFNFFLFSFFFFRFGHASQCQHRCDVLPSYQEWRVASGIQRIKATVTKERDHPKRVAQPLNGGTMVVHRIQQHQSFFACS